LKALGGWLPAACRGVFLHPEFFLRSLKERGLQSGAKNFALQSYKNVIQDWLVS
jgi:hypothetical protein